MGSHYPVGLSNCEGMKMDARIERMKPDPKRYDDEEYRGYGITFHHPTATFYVTGPNNYKRGIGALRAYAKRWIDLLIEGKVK
jgi:hypothetical protein